MNNEVIKIEFYRGTKQLRQQYHQYQKMYKMCFGFCIRIVLQVTKMALSINIPLVLIMNWLHESNFTA
jgi:hypothetical protein